ncbi:extracellular solute-binding protein [Frigidibacter sp. SD6-1]|uniref:extracellular solute-binding protein n=1 Tax=Frigidibacter sp. SD6-1 TaxID=3032581 RepID=UPI0024DFC4EA|nr:extracellular solute-binding protein [Frigidibacter sp. SD6-1]
MVHYARGALALTAALLMTTAAVAQDKRVVKYNADHDQAPLAAMERVIADLEAANPDIDIQLNNFDHEGYKTAIRNFLTADAPDLANWYAGNRMAPFVNSGQFMDVSDVWEANGLKDSFGSALASMTIDGKQWGVSYMRALCPDAILLQYVNPMAIDTWSIAARYRDIRQVGLCHSVQGTAHELARDLGIDPETLVYRAGGINHMAFYTEFGQRQPDGSIRDLYPALREGYRAGRMPLESSWNPRCPNLVRYEVMMHLGYFVTESSEHFAEYVPWFIKSRRPDLIERFRIPLDEYPKRCEEQLVSWKAQAASYRTAERIEVNQSHEYVATIMNAVTTGTPSVIYGNVANHGLIPQLPTGSAVEVPCLVDANGIQPTPVTDLAPQLTALMRTNVNVQELTVAALLTENRDHIHHAAMLDPHTAAELDLGQIRALVDDLIAAHGEWLPTWARGAKAA